MGSLRTGPDFDRLTRVLLGTAKHGRISIKEFKKTFPEIHLQIQSAAQSPYLNCWGQSRNIDDHAGLTIVDPKVLSLIGRIAKTKIRNSMGYHSGLLHTFGYLFSLLQTPYGMKRDRWIHGVIEKGLGLESRWLFPVTQGAFFDRVSELMGLIAWQGISAKRLSQFQFSTGIVNSLNSLKSTRIIEHPKTNAGGVKKILTDLVWFSKPVKGQSALLIYSVQFASCPIPRLQTCFPVSQSAADELIESANNSIIELQYNSAIAEFPKSVKGKRSVRPSKYLATEITK